MAGTAAAVQVLLVTANVGSIFEDPSVMLKIWTEEFLQTVARLDPKFIAIHCQEVGGKNYEKSMKHVEYFVRLLMTSEELRLFDKVRVYLDEDFSSAENFTALGNFYFIHESLSDALVWDFAGMNFVPASGKEVHSGNIEAVTTKEKAKFPQDFFPECKWSRKGFLRTRWSLSGTIFDLINIHLFHDASNFLAMEAFPSVYCKNRRRALEHTLERFHNDSHGAVPFFVFGDFNFRTDTQGVVAKLSEGLNQVRVQNSSKADQTKMQYQDENSQVILSVGKKEFSHSEHQNMFAGDDGIWLKTFDRELDSFSGSLFEFPISFPPSYPFEEDENGAKCYMKTRCPAWCDRVILANTATSLVNNLSDHSCVEYGVIGSSTCMGDHKPVYLSVQLLSNTGTVCCCPPYPRAGVVHCLNGLSRSPVLDTLTLPRLAPYVHEPYTPESMDTPSPSPSPTTTPGEVRDMHKSFNDSVAARLRQQSANIQGEQGALLEINNSRSDWTHCQASEVMDIDSPLDDNHYSDFNANTKQKVFRLHELELCGIDNKPLLQSPQVLVTQFAQISNAIPDLDRFLISQTELYTEPFTEKYGTEENEREATEIPPGCLPSDYNMAEKTNKVVDNVVSSQETLMDGVKDVKLKKTFVRCLQSQSASEMKVSSLDTMEAKPEIELDSDDLGMRTSRCFSDASWLQRNKPLSRVQLISGSESMSRLQSHHSSSDEDWFEEIVEANDATAGESCAVPVAKRVEVKTVDLEHPAANRLEVKSDDLENPKVNHVELEPVVLESVETSRLEVKPYDLENPKVNHVELEPVVLESVETSRLEVKPYDLENPKSNQLELERVDLESVETSLLEVKQCDERVEADRVEAGWHDVKPCDVGAEVKPVKESVRVNIPDLCALLHDHVSVESSPRESVEVVRLYKNLSDCLDQATSTSDQWSMTPECGDASTASLMAYFQEQSEALVSEPASEPASDSDHEPEDKGEPNTRCAACCVVL